MIEIVLKIKFHWQVDLDIKMQDDQNYIEILLVKIISRLLNLFG